jgi:hypothetical protein
MYIYKIYIFYTLYLVLGQDDEVGMGYGDYAQIIFVSCVFVRNPYTLGAFPLGGAAYLYGARQLHTHLYPPLS